MKNNKLYTELIALCDNASVSNESKLSINGIFDELRVNKMPGGIVEKYLVATIHGEPEKQYSLSVKLHVGDSKHNLLNPTLIDARMSPNGKHNLIIKLQNVGFEKEGDYRFTIYYGDEEIGSTQLKVMAIKQKTRGGC